MTGWLALSSAWTPSIGMSLVLHRYAKRYDSFVIRVRVRIPVVGARRGAQIMGIHRGMSVAMPADRSGATISSSRGPAHA